MREFFKYILKCIMRMTLHVFCIFPLKKNKIFFMSNMGKNYSCNPKYLYEYMVKNSSNLKFYWAFKKTEDYKFLINNPNTKIICKNNLIVYFYHLLTAKVIVYNCGGFSYAPIRKRQYLIETWHGGGAYKKCGLSVDKKSKYSKKGVIWASNSIKLFVESCEKMSSCLLADAFDYKGEVIKSGMPRNDLFFNENIHEIKKKIYSKVGIDEEKKIVLYAPTFRGNEWNASSLENKYEEIDFCRLKNNLKIKFGGEWVICTRAHQYAKLDDKSGVDFNLSGYQDMQELLLITDVLITDYSSSIWDFGLQNKPAFLYTPDLKNYECNDRGFYVPIESWQGILCENNNQLEKEILSFDDKDYLARLKSSYELYGSYENGNACKTIFERIQVILKG